MDGFDMTADQCCEWAEDMRIFAQPQRLLILFVLRQKQRIVADIECLTGITQPMLSQYLAQLRRAEIVLSHRKGRQTFYRFAPTLAAQRALAVLDILSPQLQWPSLSSLCDEEEEGGHGAQFVRLL